MPRGAAVGTCLYKNNGFGIAGVVPFCRYEAYGSDTFGAVAVHGHETFGFLAETQRAFALAYGVAFPETALLHKPLTGSAVVYVHIAVVVVRYGFEIF